jgi:hypothetical protein
VNARTQESLYRSIDLELSWSERALPQTLRTKHVHGLHPYLGKFVPQLVEVFLQRYFAPGDCVYDPFCGSGTTLVEANAFACDAIGCDISAFNCLLARVKARPHRLAEVELALRGTLESARRHESVPLGSAGSWVRRWYAPRALGELLAYRAAAEQLEPNQREVAWIVLSRAARSARLTTHFDLDFPREPISSPYWCEKHKRECRPVEEAAKFLRRYTEDTLRRLRAFASVRTKGDVSVLHADARLVELPAKPSGIVTSPPYPGLIDYHEQHRYAYELLGLEDRRDDEIGRAERGRTRTALAAYVEETVAVFTSASRRLDPGSPVVIVVNDSLGLYPQILERSDLLLDERLTRHVNRRTGRRKGEFFEDVLVCRRP